MAEFCSRHTPWATFSPLLYASLSPSRDPHSRSWCAIRASGPAAHPSGRHSLCTPRTTCRRWRAGSRVLRHVGAGRNLLLNGMIGGGSCHDVVRTWGEGLGYKASIQGESPRVLSFRDHEGRCISQESSLYRCLFKLRQGCTTCRCQPSGPRPVTYLPSTYVVDVVGQRAVTA